MNSNGRMDLKHQTENHPPVLVPVEALSAETLQALIESFILREGTDYGRQEVEHQTKLEQIKRQMDKGQVKIVFDPNSESVTLMTDRDWKRLSTNQN
ncbi:MAG: YheU family protein [Pseudobdellovibrionaceae bacterium]